MRFGSRAALIGAFVSFAVLAAIGAVAHLSARASDLDADLLEAMTRLRTELRIDRALEAFVHLGDPLPYLLASLLILAAAGARGGIRLVLALGAVLVLAPLSAELLKIATAQTREHSVTFADHISRASWPSGHTTGAATAAICALVAAPPRWRVPVAFAGALYALAMGYAVIALVWHFPSDALGAYFLSAGWCLLALRAAGLPQRL